MQLHHVHHADCDRLLEGHSGAPVVERALAGLGQFGALEQREDLFLARAVENRRRRMHTRGRLRRKLHHLGVRQILDKFLAFLFWIILAQAPCAICVGVAPLAISCSSLRPEFERRPAKMGLQNLADVHPRRHAERIKHDIDRRAVRGARHVLCRQDARQHAFVAVASGHLVADLQAALDRDEHLDHLDHAGRQFVACLQPIDLGPVMILHRLDVGVHRGQRIGDFARGALLLDLELAP